MRRYQPKSTVTYGVGISGYNPATGNALEVSPDGLWMFVGDQAVSTGRYGKVYVYKMTDGAWVLHQTLTNGNGETSPGWFGYALDLSGNWLAVSSTHQLHTSLNPPVGSEGDCQMFEYVAATDLWTYRQTVVGNDTGTQDEFALCVAVSGNWLLCGSPFNNSTGSNSRSGAIYFYELVAGVWTFRQKIVEPTPVTDDTFGLACEIDGEWAFAHSMATSSGRMRVYKLTAGVWAQHSILAGDRAGGETFGRPMRCDGNLLVCGGPMRNSTVIGGAVYFFELIADTWVKKTVDIPTGLYGRSWFPNCVSIRGRYAIAGSLFADRSEYTGNTQPQGMNGDGKGRTIIYERMADGTWVPFDFNPDGLAYFDWFGTSVAVQGKKAYSLQAGTNVQSAMKLHEWERLAGAHYSSISATSLSTSS